MITSRTNAMNETLFPASARARQRLHFYLNRLKTTRRNYPITLSIKECTLIRELCGCAARDREFIRRAFAGLHKGIPRFDTLNQSEGASHE